MYVESRSKTIAENNNLHMTEKEMSELDKMSEAIGRLDAEVNEARRQQMRVLEKLDDARSDSIDSKLLLQKHISEFQQHRKEFLEHTKDEAEKYESIKVFTEEYRAFKNKAAGALVVIAFMGAALWEGTKIMLRKMGW